MLKAGDHDPRDLEAFLQGLVDDAVENGRLTSGKIGRCARDMVGECHRCARVVCRVKRPPNPDCEFY